MLKSKDKKKILKAAREKVIIYKETPVTADFFSETEARRQSYVVKSEIK